MAESIKFNNNVYLDASGVWHNGKTLKQDLDGKIKIKSQYVGWQSVHPTTLHDVNFDIPTDMTTYIGSIAIVAGVSAVWEVGLKQIDMYLYNGTNAIRVYSDASQTLNLVILTFYI